MGQKGFPPNVSQELMFQTSAQFDKEIQSYPSTNKGYRNCDINCGKDKCTIMFPKGNEPFIW